MSHNKSPDPELMNKIKRVRIPFILIIVTGTLLVSNNRLENTRTVDIVLLLVLGALFGVLISNLREINSKKK